MRLRPAHLLLCTPLCAAILGSCGGDAEPEALYPEASVFFLTIDTLRMEHVGSGGSQRDTTPVLDRIASEGVFFEQCYAQSAWTLPSMVSLLTSMTPSELGVEQGAFRDHETGEWIAGGIAPEVETLTEILKRNGFQTAGFSSNPHLSRKQGFQQGFDEFDDETLMLKGADDVFRTALRWLEGAPDEPFFLWTHLFDPHFEKWGMPPRYDVPAGYEEIFPAETDDSVAAETRWKYDTKIRAMDDSIGKFLRALEKRGHLENTIVIVAVDHGEEFMEDGRWGHSRSVRDSLVQVPLWIRLPDQGYAGVRVDEIVQNMDVGKTILDLVGIRPHPAMEGASLLPLFAEDLDRGPYAEGPVYGETTRQGVDYVFWVDPEKRRKLVYDRLNDGRALFDLDDDPEEHSDLATAEPAVLAEMEQELAGYLDERKPIARSRATLSDEEVNSMRGMGYIGDE